MAAGRKSSLTDRQWSDIGDRLVRGELASYLAREYGVSKSNISGRFSERMAKIKVVAGVVAKAEEMFSALEPDDKIRARCLIYELHAISASMASAARYGAATSQKLAKMAHDQVALVDVNNPMDTQEVLQGISALTKMSNDASVIAMGLLNANRDAMEKASNKNSEILPVSVTIERKSARRINANA